MLIISWTATKFFSFQQFFSLQSYDIIDYSENLISEIYRFIWNYCLINYSSKNLSSFRASWINDFTLLSLVSRTLWNIPSSSTNTRDKRSKLHLAALFCSCQKHFWEENSFKRQQCFTVFLNVALTTWSCGLEWWYGSSWLVIGLLSVGLSAPHLTKGALHLSLVRSEQTISLDQDRTFDNIFIMQIHYLLSHWEWRRRHKS